MNKSVLSKVLLMAISPLAFAESRFDGLNVTLGAGIYNVESSYSNSDMVTDISGNILPSMYSTNTSKILGDLRIGYSHGFQNNFNLAGNLFYNIGSVDQNYHNGAVLDLSGNLIIDTKFRLQNIFGASIEPGYYITNSILGYLKLGYVSTSLKANASGYVESVNYNFGSPKGFLYGLGLKHTLTDNLFFGADLYRINFGSAEITNSPHFSSPENLRVKLDVNYFGITAGYTFK